MSNVFSDIECAVALSEAIFLMKEEIIRREKAVKHFQSRDKEESLNIAESNLSNANKSLAILEKMKREAISCP
ncbi:hypothetical protein ABT56_20250 [Photobacterium aquae]|uniref:Uncharacterized protein n=1 Tax=Photobacterium aquae TaxID=1195763 RepID=A0A0J1GU53_9GAMM|nr:hypothetical protein [Photobacterium aquae]KLV03260.1 hypothetical protein ABT56_20250 [Photobacterium aquae]